MKKLNLSTTTNVTTNFVGDAATDLITDALLSGKTLDNNWITILPDVKYATTLPRFSTGSIIQADSDDVNGGDGIAVVYINYILAKL